MRLQGVTGVELFEDAADGGMALVTGPTGAPVFHRGFCFAEFVDHRSAHAALKKLQAAGSSLIPPDYDGGMGVGTCMFAVFTALRACMHAGPVQHDVTVGVSHSAFT